MFVLRRRGGSGAPIQYCRISSMQFFHRGPLNLFNPSMISNDIEPGNHSLHDNCIAIYLIAQLILATTECDVNLQLKNLMQRIPAEAS